MKKLTVAALAVLAVAAPIAVVVVGTAPTPPEQIQCGAAAEAPYGGPIPKVSGHTADQIRTAVTIWQTSHRLASQLNGAGATTADDAAVIAIAVARQESTLGAAAGIDQPNGDGDAGVFQQRTLPGWYGTLDQVTTVTYAAETFLLGHTVTQAEHDAAAVAGTTPAGPPGYPIPGLADVPQWQILSAVDAAHAVQRSQFPTAISDDLPVARQMVASFKSGNLTNPAAANVQAAACAPISAEICPPSGLTIERGLTPDALRVLRCGKEQFPQVRTWLGVGDRPATVDDDHQTGRAVDVMIPDYQSPAGQQLGRQIAEWAIANRDTLGVKYVIWNAQIWSQQRAGEGWRDCGSSEASCYAGADDNQAHRNHVHISVFGAVGGTDNGGAPIGGTGRITTPVEDYIITARFGQVGNWARYHTGVDFAAPVGAPIRAAAGGTVTHAGPGGSAGGWAGIWIAIRHPDGTSSLYAHTSGALVQVGQQVPAGQHIANVGMTGRTFGPHLHFEVYPPGKQPGDVYQAVDPAAWLTRNGATV